jgi:glycosyltransferase involved in cell wall biosynthesis
MKTSVAMCTYNGEEYLLKQLQSIIYQTQSVDEIVICDDCSEDHTLEIIRDFKEKCPIPIMVMENAGNVGYVKNFEQAIGLCSGDIIFLSDQDDIWMPEKVAVICDFFEKHSAVSFVFTNAQLINFVDANSYDKTLLDVVGWDRHAGKLFRNGFGYEVLATSGRITGATSALRASFIPYCIPFPSVEASMAHDEMIAVQAMLANKIACIEDCLIKYRLHYNQSIGVDALFKSPSGSWETAQNILMYHQELIETHEQFKKDKLSFIYKRFYAIRNPFSVLRLCRFFRAGEYRSYYAGKALSVFRRDLTSVFKRLQENIFFNYKS